MGVYASPNIVEDGLVLHLDAANTRSYSGTGTTWSDISGNGNNGTLTNGPTYNTDNLGNLVFDGVNDYINLNYDLSWNNTNSVTLFFYVKPNSLTSYYPFLGKGPTGWEWQINQKTTSLEFVYWNTGGGHTNGPILQITNFFTSTDEFVNVAVVWSHIDNKYYFFRNGILVNTTTWVNASINQNNSGGIKLGGNIYKWATSGNYWPGKISNLLVFSRALSQAEIEQNFKATRGRFRV